MNGAAPRPGLAAPILLAPLLKERVWGGRRLAEAGIALPPEGRFGEAWLLADLPDSVPDGRCRVLRGPGTGAPLRALVEERAEALLGALAGRAAEGFPLLVKLLDARENLSVQLHPSPRYAARHPGCAVKSEAWLVLGAEPGALIHRGFVRPLDREEFRRRCADGSIVECLRSYPARTGDCHHLPSGTCHALGAGILAAEVQTPSDTTFRIYDWGRSGRALHLDEAVECLFDESGRMRPEAVEGGSVVPAPTLGGTDEAAPRRICATPDFVIDLIAGRAGDEVALPRSAAAAPTVLLPLDGPVRLAVDRAEPPAGEPIPRGHAAILPADAGAARIRFEAGSTLMRIELPSGAVG